MEEEEIWKQKLATEKAITEEALAKINGNAIIPGFFVLVSPLTL